MERGINYTSIRDLYAGLTASTPGVLDWYDYIGIKFYPVQPSYTDITFQCRSGLMQVLSGWPMLCEIVTQGDKKYPQTVLAGWKPKRRRTAGVLTSVPPDALRMPCSVTAAAGLRS